MTVASFCVLLSIFPDKRFRLAEQRVQHTLIFHQEGQSSARTWL